MKDTILINRAVLALNLAVEEADQLSGYALDSSDPWELVNWLLQHDRLGLAIELHNAAKAAHCWEETSVSSR